MIGFDRQYTEEQMKDEQEGTYRVLLDLSTGKVHVRNYHEEGLHPTQWDEVRDCLEQGVNS